MRFVPDSGLLFDAFTASIGPMSRGFSSASGFGSNTGGVGRGADVNHLCVRAAFADIRCFGSYFSNSRQRSCPSLPSEATRFHQGFLGKVATSV